jgi:hypothetical protein
MFHEPESFSTERRKGRRTLMARQVAARFDNDDPFAISLVNISKRGFLASCDRTLSPGMVIRLADNPDYNAEIVRVSDGVIACRFARAIDPFDLLSQTSLAASGEGE